MFGTFAITATVFDMQISNRSSISTDMLKDYVDYPADVCVCVCVSGDILRSCNVSGC